MIDVELQISRNFPFRAILHASKFSDSPQLFDIASFYFFFVGYNLHVFSATFARKYTVALGVIIVYILQNLGNLGLILPFSRPLLSTIKKPFLRHFDVATNNGLIAFWIFYILDTKKS